MNILEVENLVKGMPDERLMQEAQQPSGQIPQYLTISEIQRRKDMRKRFQAQQEQPQGTVADQIMQGGIAGLAPQQQGFAGQPPQQMAYGGQVQRMAGGGQTMWVDTGYGRMAEIDTAGFPNQLAAYEAMWNRQNEPLGYRPYGPNDVRTVQFDQEGNLITGGAPVGQNPAGVQADVARDSGASSAGGPAAGIGMIGDWLFRRAGTPVEDRVQEIADAEAPASRGGPRSPTAGAAFGIGAIGDWIADNAGAGFAPVPLSSRRPNPEEDVPAPSRSGPAGGSSDLLGELGITALGDEADDDWLGIPYRRDLKGGTGAQTQGLTDARDSLVDTANSRRDIVGRLLAMTDEESPKIPDFADLIAQEKEDARNAALIQFGAGLASDDIGGGIRNAGLALSQGRQSAREMDARARLLGYKAQTEDMSRDIEILGKAGVIEASMVRAEADSMIEQGRSDRAALDFVRASILKAVDGMMTLDPKDPQAKFRAIKSMLRQSLPPEVLARTNLDSLAAEMTAGGGDGDRVVDWSDL